MSKSLAYWNKYIQSQIPDLELVKGEGYMYFSWSEKASLKGLTSKNFTIKNIRNVEAIKS